jgi:predicted NAD/FAD-binding protein
LLEVKRFHKSARALLDGQGDAKQTWGEFLDNGRYSNFFVQHFAIPLVSCVWSSGDTDSRSYPAKHLFEFLGHHGMLTIKNSPTWRTVVGGSRTYVREIVKLIHDVRTDAAVTKVVRSATGVAVTSNSATGEKTETFDYAIIATHSNAAAEILQDASAEERNALTAVPYSQNHTWLHTDDAVMPSTLEARASWNYRMRECNSRSEQVLVSYWMNRLMNLPGDENFMVTLNPTGWVDESKVLRQMNYEHPVFTHEALAAAAILRNAGGDRLAFAGAHLGWGFHEDGARSGVEAARKFGGTW